MLTRYFFIVKRLVVLCGQVGYSLAYVLVRMIVELRDLDGTFRGWYPLFRPEPVVSRLRDVPSAVL